MIQKGIDYLRYGWQLLDGSRIQHERWIASLRHGDMVPFVYRKESLVILDLANGQLRPQYKILRSQGHHVYGVDIVNCPKRSWREGAYEIARKLFARRISANNSRIDDTLVCSDVCSLPFRDQTFDVITSVAAFEHFLDVPKVLKEIHRVARPGALIWVLVHLFSSPSGGHNISLSQIPLRNIPHGIDPWDHLRKRRLPFHVPLNQWRTEQYLSEVGRNFEILKHYCAMREGEHLLTPQIEAELTEYSRDELTCGAYAIVARKSL
jgi:ubiquinone/menaquinone biosynthesis C-methylase UbiE